MRTCGRGDFEAVNQGGDSTTPVGKMTAVHARVDNQASAYLSSARGVAAQIANGSGADIETAAAFEVLPSKNPSGTIDTLIGLEIADIDQGTDNYAIRTAAGKVQLGELGVGLVKSDNNGLLTNAVQGTDFDAEMTGATAIANGVAGIVPQPLIADKDKFLKGDGTWADTSSNGNATALNDLSDVNIAGATDGDILIYNGTQVRWMPQAPSRGRLELITEDTLTTDVANVTISSLSLSNYKTLIFTWLKIRSSGAGSRDLIYLRFNGDTALNYNFYGVAIVNAAQYPFWIAGNTLATGFFSRFKMEVSLPAGSDYKPAHIQTGLAYDIEAWDSFVWKNTDAITQIEFFSAFSSNILAGSQYAIYGVK
ncbi:MAG: hypothetical protein Q9P01_12265 [Anaerolineae bacterium]|nr:hypothetical protein [Anaerolineae bacterium]